MAKISANNATETARIISVSPTGQQWLWVMCSDGRILRRLMGTRSSAYSVYERDWRGDRTQAVLVQIANANGHTIVDR